MDYEKKYKEALELARVAAFNGHQSLMEGIFPELRESEDEKIRKDIIFYIKAIANNENISPDSKKECKTWIAWLEKQGREKPQRMISAEAKEAMYDKPACAWNEEDEEMYNSLTEFEKAVKQVMEEAIECGDTHNLKADADMLLRLTQKPWSEKDKKEYKYVLKFVDNILNNCGNKKDYEHCKRCYDWLKSLKQRIGE